MPAELSAMINDVNMFIIRALKLLFMQGKYILSVLVVILLVCSPAAATTKKIASGATVFVGESDLDITAAMKTCHTIGWWPTDNTSAPAARNVTVKQLNEANGLATHFNLSPQVFDGYTGNWYCEDIKPAFLIFTVADPQLSIKAWDLDNNADVTGQAVPISANVTYLVETNLFAALGYYNRTDLTPADGFFTVVLTDPSGKKISTIYTDSDGAANREILSFDSSPFITTPSYFGKSMAGWNHRSRNVRGDYIYPAGTYTFTITQDLNKMKEAYSAASITDQSGKTTATASVQFLPEAALSQTTAAKTPAPNETTIAPPPTEVLTEVTETLVPTTAPVATKTTYSPLPAWIVLAGLGIAGFVAFRRGE
jgi:hypothetical protein